MLYRIRDVFISLFFLICLSPILLSLLFFSIIFIGNPIFFKQLRPGYKEESFYFYKFRTMTSQTNTNGELLPDIDRITIYGNFLRKTSLDELPSLWNVLKGEMSIVGPRPLLEEYLDLYSPKQKIRHELKPGVTGWAQINGRNSISWDKKFKLDIWYVKNRTFWLDLKIIFKTILIVIKRENISHEEYATMPKFKRLKNE